MNYKTLQMTDGHQLPYYEWQPSRSPTATVQIAHGMGEHAGRYQAIANALIQEGFAVYANDHRGHGLAIKEELSGYMGVDGWDRTVSDMHEFAKEINARHSGIPHILFGHSMGSMLSQQYLTQFADTLDAAILSGSPGFSARVQLLISRAIAKVEGWRLGKENSSDLLDSLVFGKANNKFNSPTANGFEWLSRDSQAVNKYLQDPLCGFVLSTGSLGDMFRGVSNSAKKKNIQKIPKNLPLYIFSGGDDPVHDNGKGLNRLLKIYRNHLSDITYKLYPGGRHEMLNETNSEEVTADIISWLQQTLNKKA